MTHPKKHATCTAAVLLCLSLVGCQPAAGGEVTGVGQTHAASEPAWTYAGNSYLTDEGVRFRLSDGELAFEVLTGDGTTWCTYRVPVRDMSGGEGYCLPHVETVERFLGTTLFFGQTDDRGEKLWLAFGLAEEYPSNSFCFAHFFYLSDDGGETWTSAAPPALTVNTLGCRQTMKAAAMHQNGTMCAVMEASGLEMKYTEAWVSPDFGKTWEEVPFAVDELSVCDRVTSCRVAEDGTVRIDGVSGDGAVLVYEKAPAAKAFVCISRVPTGAPAAVK